MGRLGIICSSLFYWSIYASFGLIELLFIWLFKQTFVLCHKKEQVSTQFTILILQ